MTRKARQVIVRMALAHRQGRSGRRAGNRSAAASQPNTFNREIVSLIEAGINAEIKKNNRLVLILPSVMNFSTDYEETARYINFIRKLTSEPRSIYKYRLTRVAFSKLKKISTSAALVLTAELSKWDDAIRNTLVPSIQDWDSEILKRFTQLGFFELFDKKPTYALPSVKNGGIDVVKYIKGRCGDKDKVKVLKAGIAGIVGDAVGKWTFLDSGLSEAITNVTHHAYPEKYGFQDDDKNWYLTGGYNKGNNELKIIFYDQGIGIPKSLPASEFWEVVAKVLDKLPLGTRFQDEVMLKAAVELNRTSTGDVDRGKGLPDLLQFIKQRGGGYLSILSGHALYKYTLNAAEGGGRVKSERFVDPIKGTLIIWKVVLNEG